MCFALLFEIMAICGNLDYDLGQDGTYVEIRIDLSFDKVSQRINYQFVFYLFQIMGNDELTPRIQDEVLWQMLL